MSTVLLDLALAEAERLAQHGEAACGYAHLSECLSEAQRLSGRPYGDVELRDWYRAMAAFRRRHPVAAAAASPNALLDPPQPIPAGE